MKDKKKALIVADFDKTLIPYDSFRKYCLLLLRYKPLSIGLMIILRKFRILSSRNFKKRIINLSSKISVIQNIENSFVSKIYKDINNTLLGKLKHILPDDGVLIIVSASPMRYMEKFESLMGIKCYGSYSSGSEFIELYGKKKREFVLSAYPKSQYRYSYSISDSNSDLPLLHEFEKYDIIN